MKILDYITMVRLTKSKMPNGILELSKDIDADVFQLDQEGYAIVICETAKLGTSFPVDEEQKYVMYITGKDFGWLKMADTKEELVQQYAKLESKGKIIGINGDNLGHVLVDVINNKR